MKKTLDFTIVMYIAVAMALATLHPDVGMESTVAKIASNTLLFLEAMKIVTYLFSIAMVTWFLKSKKAVVEKKQSPSLTIAHFKDGKNTSDVHFVLLIFLILTPSFPSQAPLIWLLVTSSALRLTFKVVAKKALVKANSMIKPEDKTMKEESV